MEVDTILCVDSETSGLDPKADALIEIGAVWWSIEHASVIESWSTLVQHTSNAAEAVNRIPAPLLRRGMDRGAALERLRIYAAMSGVIVAHRAEFDRGFLGELGRPWVCSKFDLAWPLGKPGDHLVHLALAHGVAITSAHRALTDCMILARLFERVAEMGHDIRAMLTRAMRPKALFAASVSYDDREKAKSAGFQWQPAEKQWTRRMAVEDAGALGFPVRKLQDIAP